MITPLDIEKKEFSRSMRGFNMDEVDAFLDLIIVDLQKIMDENDRLKNEVSNLNQELAKYRKSENSVMNTLESAKKLMNDISESAERRAEIIIKNAQLDADVIQRDARESVSKLTEEGERLREKVNRYREKYRQLLEDELSQLDGSSEELFAALERDFVPASMTESSVDEVKTRIPVKKETQPIPAVKPVENDPLSRATIVIEDRSLEDILKEDFGVEDMKIAKKAVKEDLTKTRVF